jgi:hypothetical protein
MPAALLALVAAAADPAADLRALGTEIQAELVQRSPGPDGKDDEISALGTCKRPGEAERARLAKLVVPADVAADSVYYVRVGCEDAGGVVVEASYDRKREGVWTVSRVAGSKVTTLASYRGTSIQDYMEWANEVSVSVGALVDVDGDGVHDALVVRNIHEGGASHNEQELSLWSSRSGRTTPLGTFGDTVAVARGRVSAPIVLSILRNDEPPRYRCVEANGTLDLCAAIEGARHIDRMFEITEWFIAGHEYGIERAKVPDRDLLAELLAELGVPSARRAQLLAEVPATAREQRVAREIERFLAGSPVKKFGELVDPQPADTRAAEITALAGDTACTMAPADVRRAKAAVERWIADHEAAALADGGSCPHDGACRWKRHTPPELVATCGDAANGYVAAHWTYSDGAAQEMLARDVAFDFTRASATVLASAAVAGPSFTCSACGFGPPGIALDSSFYRHDGKRLALVLDMTKDPQVLHFAINGKSASLPPASLARARLREPESTLRTILESGGDGAIYWHWDGEWKQVVEVPNDAVEPPATLAGLGLRMWQETARVYAIWSLKTFDAKAWAGNKAIRALTRRELVIVGADAETLARIDAE